MSTVSDRLARLREVREGAPPNGLPVISGFAFAPALAVALLTILSGLLVLAAVLVAHQSIERPPASHPANATAGQVAGEAGFAPHTLRGETPRLVSYLSSKATKGPMAGTPGIVIVYSYRGADLEIYEYRDPNPATPIAVNPQTQAPAAPQQIGSTSTLVWMSPDRTRLNQIGFKTADGLVVYVVAPAGIIPAAADSLVAQLVG
jgi:hypothetical protein